MLSEGGRDLKEGLSWKGDPLSQGWGLEPVGECMVVAHWIHRRYWFAQAGAAPAATGKTGTLQVQAPVASAQTCRVECHCGQEAWGKQYPC